MTNVCKDLGDGSLQALFNKKGICSFVKKVGTPERSRLIERYMQTYTPNANMADHSDGPELVAWKRGQSVCDLVCFDYASCVVL